MFKLTTKSLDIYIKKKNNGYVISDDDAYNILINKLNFSGINEFTSQVNKICCNKDERYKPSVTGVYKVYNLNSIVLQRLMNKLRASGVDKLTKNQLIVYNVILTVIRMNSRLFHGVPYKSNHTFMSLLSLSKANYFLWLDIKNGFIFPLWDNDIEERRLYYIIAYSTNKFLNTCIKSNTGSKHIEYVDNKDMHKEVVREVKLIYESKDPKQVLDIAFYNNILAKDSVLNVWDDYPNWYKTILERCWK